ncbi:hypothetical protein X772_25810 [Mesorhizobium sp. LSJC280B00]|nr:hypothetical protein X772_25810 [Mesorhizobium sp. LSJC280B00]
MLTFFVMLLFLQNLRATIPDDRRSGDSAEHIRRARPCRLLDADDVCHALPPNRRTASAEMVFLPFPQPALEFSSQIKL